MIFAIKKDCLRFRGSRPVRATQCDRASMCILKAALEKEHITDRDIFFIENVSSDWRKALCRSILNQPFVLYDSDIVWHLDMTMAELEYDLVSE